MCAQLRREEKEFFVPRPHHAKCPSSLSAVPAGDKEGRETNTLNWRRAITPHFCGEKPRAMQNALYGDTQNVVALQGITLKRLNGKVVMLALTHDWGNSCAMLYKSMLSFTFKGR